MTANIGTPQQHEIKDLKIYHQNPRVGDVEAIAQSLQVNGAYKPIVVNKGTHTGRPNEVLAGNHTLKAHRLLVERGESQWATIATWVVDVDDEQAARIVLADNRTADLGSYDNDDLLELLGSLDDGLEGTGYDEGYIDALLGANIPDAGMEALDGDNEYLDGEEAAADGADFDTPPAAPAVDKGGLVRRFIQPPFTVIDTRKGEWRDRKRQWVALGVNSGDGRDAELTFTSAIGKYGNWYDVRAKAKAADPNITDQQIEEQYADELKPYGNGSGTSEFDPALAELLVTWFSAPGQLVLDPWAGGSVRGIVSAALGRQYVGIDLRPEQIDVNREQWGIVQKQLPTTGHLDTVADERPTIRPVSVTPGAATNEAMALYAATSSTPLRDTWQQPLPKELHEYLQLIYGAWEQPLDAEMQEEATTPWAPLVDNTDECWVLFTGGKDSVAAALQAERDGYTPVLFHVAGINRGMSDELGYAQAIAAARGWRLVVERVAASGKKNGLVELPTKNQVTALLLLNRMAAEGANRWTAGWHTTDKQEERGAGYDFSDGTEAVDLFDKYLTARFPGQQYLGKLTTTTEAWAEVGAAGLLRMVKGCVCPIRFKDTRRATNIDKYGPLLEGRCGSCVKCAWEQVALERLGLSEPRPEYRKHLQQFLHKAWPERGNDVTEWLVPKKEAEQYHRTDWPTQTDPATVTPAQPEEQPAQTTSVATANTTTTPTWLTGDSATVMQTHQPLKANMIIGCPPYYDLEEYSDNPDDLSNMTPEQFDAAMLETLQQADRHLQDNSFAVFIVGNVRNKHGNLQDMKTLMQHCAQQIGWNYTNDAVLINAAGSAAMRASGPFTKARTLARVHQDIIIFTKGDRKAAAAKCGEVQVKQLAADNQPEE